MNLIVFGILLVTIFQKQFSAQEAVSNDVSYEFMNPNSNSLRSNLNSYADQANDKYVMKVDMKSDRLFELENNKRTKRLIPSPAKMAGKLMCSLLDGLMRAVMLEIIKLYLVVKGLLYSSDKQTRICHDQSGRFSSNRFPQLHNSYPFEFKREQIINGIRQIKFNAFDENGVYVCMITCCAYH
ncbi:hypothetical protein DINM_003033 [Dirofilaria immitis]|nr:hypothetical protein [Dirofilaria immitis]